jgi:hypothetical protein
VRVKSGSKGASNSGLDLPVANEQKPVSPKLDRVTRMAHSLFQETEGTHLVRRAVSTDRRLTETFKASPQSQRRMIQESTDPSCLGSLFSSFVEQRIRLHQQLRSAATQALFREVGAFQGSGLECVVLPALIQAGRGTVETPAAHTCPVPAVMLTLPRTAQEGAESEISGSIPTCLKSLTIGQLTALVRAARGQQQVDRWDLPAASLNEAQWLELAGWLRQGILLQGTTARLGAPTIEVPKVANEFDSEIERTERAVIEEALNSITRSGEAWRDTASLISARLHGAADTALQRALEAFEMGDRVRSLAASACEDGAAWDAVIDELQQQPRAAIWRNVLDATVELRNKLGSPGKREAVQTAATTLALYHQRKSEVAGQALQAFRSPATVKEVLGMQQTPSPGTVAGELGEAYSSVRPRRRSRDYTGKRNPVMALSFESEEPPLKRSCQHSQPIPQPHT